jgi:hypothetical protein
VAGPKKTQDRKRLRTLIEEATVDCYDEYEQHSGLLTMIDDEVECPFRDRVVGEEVEVTGFEPPRDGFGLYAACRRQGNKYRVDVNSLEWVEPRPRGFERLEAYLLWREGVDEAGPGEFE